MEDPLNGALYAHKAIRMELKSLEGESSALDAMAGDELAALADRVAFFHSAVKGHNAGEDEVAWPALEAKYPHVTTPYTLDHQHDEETFQAIESLIGDLRGGPTDADRDGTLGRLKRCLIELNVSVTQHSLKEDRHIVPLLRASFTVPEQGAMAGRMMGYLPQISMDRIVALVMRAITPDERVDYVGMMSRGMPPERLRIVAGWIQAALPAAEWAELVARVPELK